MTAEGGPPSRPRAAVLMWSLAAWTLVVGLIGAARPKQASWHFFTAASHALFDPTVGRHHQLGLHLYAARPAYQFGPISILLAELVKVVSFGHSAVGASILIGAMILPIVWLILDARQAIGPVPHRTATISAVCALFGLPVLWTYLSVYSLHLDDALATLFTVFAIWGVARKREYVVGLGLGLAVASKPWAAAFAPLLLAVPKGGRLRAAAIAAVSGAILWVPFVIGDSATIHALGHFRIPNVPESALRALGFHNHATPGWDRMAQFVTGGLVGVWCVRTGRWPGAVMAAAAIRIAIDPSAHPYYAASFVVFVAAWELIWARWSVPVISVATTILLGVPRYVRWPFNIVGDLRLTACVLVVTAAMFTPLRVQTPGQVEPCQPVEPVEAAALG